ncbi:CdaR family transcriptional regulator [Paenisporosarcina indica]|uniref:CdaR family transcriptional regulator n=1 Tax=Paenisporosarcina indica TaxID=650093 RepID=UPI00094FE1A7|nr:sugar diacid recognition domain-containing protein [Paenisporosarcina indica]
MFDLQVLGDQIVMELSTLIEQSVIVTDKNGFVIASKDPTRLNSYHEGASISMKSHKELHITAEMCDKLQGVRQGIVLPIVISKKPIGVIGITGTPLEIEKYAKLVRKVAELFVTEFMMRQEKERGIREIEFFIFDLFTTENSMDSIEKRATLLDIDISLYNRVAIIQTFKQFEITDIENLLHIQTIHPDLKIVRWGLEKLVLLIPIISKNHLQAGLENLALKIQRISKQQVYIGVGETKEFNELAQSFQQAEIGTAISSRQNKIIFEEDLKLELLYYSIPKEIKSEFLRRTIEPLLAEEELLQNLEVWLYKKGSLQEIADELHIHKNTLKYRLNKIENILGIDLNDKNDLTMIYTAVRILTKK